jgi:RNA polymerase sigma-70 factor, ECF subfamily
MHDSTLNELIQSSRQNDAKAFRKLVEAYQEMVYVLAFRLLCNEEEAKDVVQETFIRVWKHLDRYNMDMKFSSWLLTITTRLCYDKLKAGKRKSKIQPIDQNALNQFMNGNTEQDYINKELAGIISGLTAELTPKQRLVFTLRDLEGLEVGEIEAITNLSAAKIKSNLYLARQFMRKKLEKL